MAQLKPDQGKVPGWSLCIATLNRQEALLRTLGFAAVQSCLPRQIVVVDVSDNWQDSRDKAREVLAADPDIALDYITSDVRSSAVQRNRGLELCTCDVVFMIDDDSFMYPGCAEEILNIYAADTGHEVAATAAILVGDLPPQPGEAAIPLPGRKASGWRGAGFPKKLLRTKAGRWINRKILLQNKDELFIKYDEPRPLQVPVALAGSDVRPVSFMPDSAMTGAARWLWQSRSIRPCAMLVFLKRDAARPEDFLWCYRALMWRRLVGEGLKDFLARRWDFPQLRGVLVVMREWRKVWDRDLAELDSWYPAFQKTILEDL